MSINEEEGRERGVGSGEWGVLRLSEALSAEHVLTGKIAQGTKTYCTYTSVFLFSLCARLCQNITNQSSGILFCRNDSPTSHWVQGLGEGPNDFYDGFYYSTIRSTRP